jgi:hypothetical protein
MNGSLPSIPRSKCTFLTLAAAGSSCCLMQRRTEPSPSHPEGLGNNTEGDGAPLGSGFSLRSLLWPRRKSLGVTENGGMSFSHRLACLLNGSVPAQKDLFQVSFSTTSGHAALGDQQKGRPIRAPFFVSESTIRQPARPPHCEGGCAALAIASRPPDSAPASADTGRAGSWGRQSRRGSTRHRSSA